MATNANDPAFGDTEATMRAGLTKREYMAAAVMQGLAACPVADLPDGLAKIAAAAVNWADALIAALNTSAE